MPPLFLSGSFTSIIARNNNEEVIYHHNPNISFTHSFTRLLQHAINNHAEDVQF